jgi:hypothetical protein
MAKSNGIGTMFLILFVFGFSFISCENAPPDDDNGGDIWNEITSLEQVDGTWVYSSTETRTIEEFMGEFWNDAMAAVFGEMTVTQIREATITINASEGTGSQSSSVILIFSGGNIETVWGTLKAGYTEQGFTEDNTEHSITKTINDTMAIDISDMEGAYINSVGNKLKIPAGPESSEMILIKQ